MVTLNVRQVRAAIGHLDQLVAAKGEVLVVRRGEPIARIVSVRAKQKRPSHTDLRASMLIQKSALALIRQERDLR